MSRPALAHVAVRPEPSHVARVRLGVVSGQVDGLHVAVSITTNGTLLLVQVGDSRTYELSVLELAQAVLAAERGEGVV